MKEPDDFLLIDEALDGKAKSLEKLVKKYQNYVFNISLRMLGSNEDARDASQEIFVRVITHLRSFKKKSSFKTWLFRIMMNYLLDAKKTRAENYLVSFDRYSEVIKSTPDTRLEVNPVKAKILRDETRDHCLMGMIMCLDRRHRFVFIIGELLGFDGIEGSEIVRVTPQNFRKMLSRARKKIYGFMRDNCGLFSSENPCRCELKAHALLRSGQITPERKNYQGTFGDLKGECSAKGKVLEKWFVETSSKLFGCQPVYKSPDLFSEIRKIVDQREVDAIFDG